MQAACQDCTEPGRTLSPGRWAREALSETMTLSFKGKSEESGHRVTGKRDSAPAKHLGRLSDKQYSADSTERETQSGTERARGGSVDQAAEGVQDLELLPQVRGGPQKF